MLVVQTFTSGLLVGISISWAMDIFLRRRLGVWFCTEECLIVGILFIVGLTLVAAG